MMKEDNEEFANAYTEVLEILKYIPLEDYNKVPEETINMFEVNQNFGHEFMYNPDKTLEEQGVSKLARKIIAVLFKKYWATPEQRMKLEQYDSQKQAEARTNYNNGKEDIFYNLQNETEQTELGKMETDMIVEKKLGFFEKIKSFFEKMFHRV